MPFPLLPTNAKGVYTTLPISADLDLKAVSDATLLRYGLLPRRLRTVKDNQGHSLWDRALRFGLRKIMPKVRLRPAEFQPIRFHRPQPLGNPSQNTSSNWCGCVLPGPSGWNWVTGLLTLPYLSWPPPQYLQGLSPAPLSAWVGLDGWNSDESELLQTIIDFWAPDSSTNIASFSEPNWQWYYPNPNSKFSELAIGGSVANAPQMNSGDLVQISAEYLRATNGDNWARVTWFFMNDLTEVPNPNSLLPGNPNSSGEDLPPLLVPVMVDLLFRGPTSAQAPYKGVTIEWILENEAVTEFDAQCCRSEVFF